MCNNVLLKIKSAINFRFSVLNVLNSEKFFVVHDSLLEIWSDCIEVYTDKSLKDTGSANIASRTVAYFLAADMSIEVKVSGLLSSILAKLQAVALALKCVLSSCAVVFYLDSQSVINAYVFEILSVVLDFCNQCWIEKLHIVNLIRNKNILVNWMKVKDYSRILGNIRTNMLTGLYAAICKSFVLSNWFTEAVLVFEGKKKAALAFIEYIKFVVELYYTKV
ncbi:hypothetical protein G9A89_010993 [Geosiphon pyriformis]|nr:hypothetical protein G9A89_010993 [Geosiphon pyriformis]